MNDSGFWVVCKLSGLTEGEVANFFCSSHDNGDSWNFRYLHTRKVASTYLTSYANQTTDPLHCRQPAITGSMVYTSHTRNIVEIESVDGITGIAETYGEKVLEPLEKLREQILGANALRLLGDLQPLVHGEGGGSERSQVNLVPGENPLDTSARTYAAIETACLDLVGKSVGKPVCDLIGGRVREKVSFSAYLFYKHAGGGGEGEDARKDEYGECLTPESMVRQTQQMVQQYGFKSIKLKAGVLDPDQEIETIRQLRQEFGSDFPLRIDPNSAWKLETSLEVGRALKGELSNGGYLEDPCAGLDNLATLRQLLLSEGIDTPMPVTLRSHPLLTFRERPQGRRAGHTL